MKPDNNNIPENNRLNHESENILTGVPASFDRDYDDAQKTVSQKERTAPIDLNAPAIEEPPRREEARPDVPNPDKVSSKPSHMEEKKKTPLVAILLSLFGVVLILFVLAFFFIPRFFSGAFDNTRETTFKEEKVEKIQHGEMIQINDPELGLIEIEAVAGAPKNNYDDENFSYNENGFLTYYIDGEVASCVGIDLSEYQGEVDFDAVKKAGVDYVMLRLGGRYYGEEGALFEDTAFDAYYQQAKEAGLDVGAYFFSQATSVEEGIEEANSVIEFLDKKELDYPVAFDWEIIAEEEARTDGVDGETLTDIAEAFYDTLNDAGYYAIIYSSTSLMYYRYDLARMKGYDFWVADYGEYPSMYYGFTMWQYTTEGTVNGIDGTVDLNICFKNY